MYNGRASGGPPAAASVSLTGLMPANSNNGAPLPQRNDSHHAGDSANGGTPPVNGASRGGPDGSDRLTGWKEVANYLGKGVRTAQRWEQQLGMPVHRIGGEVVFALRSEIDAWSTAKSGQRGHNGALTLPADTNGDADNGEDALSPPPAIPARAARLVLRHPHLSALTSAVLAVLVTVGIVSAIVSLRRSPEPPGPVVSVQIVGSVLDAVDAHGAVVWSHRFDEPQPPVPPEGGASRAKRHIVTDLTGDGLPEVLHVAKGDQSGQRLFVFNHDGSVRFERQWHGTVRFGDQDYHGPFHSMWVWVTKATGGDPVIWLSSRHRVEFPSVLERLDVDGNVTGEYWQGGEVTALTAGRLGDRHVVLVGGVANEGHGASLAIFDADSFGGTAPGPDAEHTCASGPPGRPLRFVIIPRDELGDLIHGESDVQGITVQADGEFTVTVSHRHLPESPLGQPICAYTDYTFGADFAPVRADYVYQYRVVHDVLFKQGLVDHDFAGHENRLFPILEWQDGRFIERWPKNRDQGSGTGDPGPARQ